VLVNLQKRYVVRVASLSDFVRQLAARLRLGKREFNVCLVDDKTIRRLNHAYRGKDKATDVLSFPWIVTDEPPGAKGREGSSRRERWGIRSFLGDVVISVPTARRNAQAEGHSTLHEVRWLILHGVLHLLGYDHECDRGEMTSLELALREQLGLAGDRRKMKSRPRRITRQ